MIRRPPGSTRTASFPTRRSSDLMFDGIEPAHPWKLEIEDHHIGTGGAGDDVLRRAERAYDLDAIFPIEGRHETFPHHGMIVDDDYAGRSEEHTSELQSLMRISYAVFCLNKKNKTNYNNN